MTTALPLAYAVRHLYESNASPYAPTTRSGRSSARRRRRRSPMAIAFPTRPRLSLFGRRALSGS
jgi:hypothetical protein